MNSNLRPTRPTLSLSQRKRRRDLWGYAMIAASLLMLGVLFAAAAYDKPEDKLDEASLCPRNEAPSRQIVIVIDQTDPFDPDGGENRKRGVAKIVTDTCLNTQKGDKISLFSFKGNETPRFPPLLQICNPGKWSDYNFLLSNKSKIDKNSYIFSERITESVELIKKDNFSPESPILEALADIAARVEFRSGSDNKFIIVSDMVQNSEKLKFYDFAKRKARDVSDNELQRATRSIVGDHDIDLLNFEFQVYQLFHERNAAASDSIKKIWERYLTRHVKHMDPWLLL